MTSFSITSLHVDLNDAAKLCVDITVAHVWPNLRRFINQFMKVGCIKIWKELMIGVPQLVRLLFKIILSTPDLSFKGKNPEFIEVAKYSNGYSLQMFL